MADWTNPVLTSQYTNLLDILKDRDFDLATMFSPTHSTGTNIPVGAVRWNPTTKIWEERNVSAGWDPLASKYNIDVDKLDGQDGAHYLAWANLTGVPATFAPSTHNHDDRYYTETEADARYGFSLDNNGNDLRLKAADGSVLHAHTVGYASTAGDAGTVAGFNVDQNLRTTDAVTLAAITATGNITAQGILYVGKNGGGNSNANFYDDTNDTWRALRWNNGGSKWQVEDAAGVFHELFHEGHVPDWSEVSGKPSTFTATAHGHVFDGTNRLQLRSETAAAHATLTGLAGELVYENTNVRLKVHDGVTAGGKDVAFLEDIPGPTNLTSYARKDQPVTFASTVDVTGNLTGSAQVQMKKGRILDTSAVGSSKVMLSIEGDSDALQIINYSAGDYEIKNPGRGNSIRITDSTAGVQFRTNSATRLIINDAGIEVTGDILLNGNTMWHSGNDGAGTGLDADKLDGIHASSFIQLHGLANVATSADDLSSPGLHRLHLDHPGVPSDIDYGTLFQMYAGYGSVSGQLAFGNPSSNNLYWRHGDAPPYGTGSWGAWRKIWHDGNDGAGSGLDADKLDGIQASSFMRKDSSQTLSNVITLNGQSGTIAGSNWNNGWFRIGTSSAGWSFDNNEMYNSGAATIGTLTGDLQLNAGGVVKIGSNRVLTTVDFTGDATTLGGLGVSKFLRSDTSDTTTGSLTVNGTVLTNILQARTGQQLILNAGESAGKVASQTGEFVYANAEGGLSVNTPDASHSNWESGYSVKTAIIKGDSITLGSNKVFHDGYHPNADKLTTARTISLTGDVTGSVSFNGTSNVSINAVVGNNSHNHTIGNITSLQSTLDGLASADTTLQNNINAKAPKASPTFTTQITTPRLNGAAASTRDKLRVWNSSSYAIGMQNSITYGGITSDYAMTFLMSNTANRGFWWGDTGHSTAQGAMSLTTNGKLSVAHSMRLGYGESDTTTPGGTYRLDVTGSTRLAGGVYINDYIYHNGDTNSYMGFGAGDDFRIVAGGRELVRLDEGSDPDTAQFMSSKFQMDSDGHFTAAGNITSNSDRRLKKNIQKIDNALDKVQQLNGVLFTMKETDQRLTGLIAQDVQKVLPEAVTGKDTLSVAYGNIVGLLVEAIKELREIVDTKVAA